MDAPLATTFCHDMVQRGHPHPVCAAYRSVPPEMYTVMVVMSDTPPEQLIVGDARRRGCEVLWTESVEELIERRADVLCEPVMLVGHDPEAARLLRPVVILALREGEPELLPGELVWENRAVYGRGEGPLGRTVTLRLHAEHAEPGEPHVVVEHFEADDALASLATRLIGRGVKTVYGSVRETLDITDEEAERLQVAIGHERARLFALAQDLGGRLAPPECE